MSTASGPNSADIISLPSTKCCFSQLQVTRSLNFNVILDIISINVMAIRKFIDQFHVRITIELAVMKFNLLTSFSSSSPSKQ